MTMLREIKLNSTVREISKPVSEFIEEGLRRSKTIDCFDFVPSNYQVVYSALDTMPRGRFCEWGSGIGIVTGLAEMLGFDACGIETNERMAAASRELLSGFGLSAAIKTGDYFEISHDADIYFTYCWPGKIPRVEHHFLSVTPDNARLLIYHGEEDVRCEVKTCM